MSEGRNTASLVSWLRDYDCGDDVAHAQFDAAANALEAAAETSELWRQCHADATKSKEMWHDNYLREKAALESTSRALSEKEGGLAAISAAIGSPRFMDPPDGGDVSLAEQVHRMSAALKASEERGERLSQELASARLRPEPSNVPAAAIKPLKWDTDPLGNMMAVAACGWATVEIRSDGRWRWSLGGVAAGTERRKEDAVKMLTASYETRVRSALENGPSDLADATKKDPGTEQREAGV